VRARRLPIVVVTLLAACVVARPDAVAGYGRGVARPERGPAADVPALECADHPHVDVWERRLRRHPGLRRTTAHGLARGRTYARELREILATRGLPPALALLPVLESGFRPAARSAAGHTGLWQLARTTARRFGLVVDGTRDDRLHPARSTHGAARYLTLLHRRYGDWPLALAAYNAGEARIDRAVARRPGATFWTLAKEGRLPEASHDYVSRFFALMRVSDEPCAAPPATSPPAAHSTGGAVSPSRTGSVLLTRQPSRIRM
jgi:hypothetical protein